MVGKSVCEYFISDCSFIVSQVSIIKTYVICQPIDYRKIRDIDHDAFKADLTEVYDSLIKTENNLALEYDSQLRAILDRHGFH